jgi:AraC family transcriptional regulator of adaptative response / DNA-3-methyladenine glycosylase II
VYLPYRAPFDWPYLIRFLNPRATPGVEVVEDGFYRRTIEIDGIAGAIEVRDDPSQARLAMRVSLPKYDCLMQVVKRACQLFDLGADALYIGRHLARNQMLARMVAERPGLRVPGAWDGFELAVRAVLGQRLMIVDAPTLVGRMVQTYGQSVEVRVPGLSRLFPRPEILAEAKLADLGIPSQRAETITSLARAVLARKITFNSYKGSEGVLAALRVLPNMDVATASYIAMRSLGEPNALPDADLALCRALGIGRGAVSSAELSRIFEEFKPWRAYAAIHLWATTENARSSNRLVATQSSRLLVAAPPAGGRTSAARSTRN